MKLLRLILLFMFFGVISLIFAEESKKVNYHKFSEMCMGADFSILIDEDDHKKAEDGAKAAFLEAQRLNNVFSDYESESELSLFSQRSGDELFQPLSSDLLKILRISKELAVETEGAFDITIGPFSRLWRISRFKKMLPVEEKLEHAKKRVGYEKLILDFKNKQGKLLVSGMVLDLGGIAKGYAADRMLEVLKANKINRVLIDAGGDLLTGDAPRGKKGWKIDIGGRRHPDLPSLVLSNKAVATSGDMEQSITFNGKTYSHLINPKSGIGLTTLSQVSVIAPTCMHADALASATLVLGKSQGIKFLKSKPLVKGYHVQKISDNVILTKTHD
jgi:thiamine biosynthesis lipoprotein